MQFVTVTAGDPTFAFPTDSSLVVPFAFATPVTRVHCLLQGFEVSYPEDDHHVRAVLIEPRVEFDELASPVAGQVRVHFVWRDVGGGFSSARISTFFARLLIVGE